MPKGCALTGDWNRLRSFLKSGQDYVNCVNEVVEQEAYKIRDNVENAFPYGEPNAPTTIRRKGFNAPLIESGELQKSIVVTDYKSRDRDFKHYYVIHGNPNKKATRSDLNMEQLLSLMELGTNKAGKSGEVSIPPRPVLTETFDRLKQGIEKEIIGKGAKNIKEAIRKV